MREALGSPHVESRTSRGPSRATLLRLSQPELSARVRDIDDADAILVVGTDPLHSSPILDLRIRKAIRRNGAKLAVATERPTALDGGAEAAARYAPGGATGFLAELADCLGARHRGWHRASGGRGPPRRRERRDRLGRADRPRGRGSATALLDVAAALDLAGKDGSGLLEVPELTNARGLREAGCLPDAGPGLSETRSFEPHSGANGATRGQVDRGDPRRARVRRAQDLLLFGVDPLRDFPDTDAWERALAAADHVVAFSTFENATTAMADVVFPLETHAEKDGTVTHPDGRLQRVRPSAPAPATSAPTGASSQSSPSPSATTRASAPSPRLSLPSPTRSPSTPASTTPTIAGRGIRWQDATPLVASRCTRTAPEAADRR